MKTPEQIADDLIEENQDQMRPVAAALYVAKKIAQYGPTYPVYKAKLFAIMPEGRIPEYFEQIGKHLYVKPKEFWKEVIRILDDRI